MVPATEKLQDNLQEEKVGTYQIRSFGHFRSVGMWDVVSYVTVSLRFSLMTGTYSAKSLFIIVVQFAVSAHLILS